MNKLVWGAFSLAVLTACTGRKTNGGETAMNDSDSLLVQKDSLLLSGEKDYKAVYSHADNLFDDFLYAFTTDRKFQKQRIAFPLILNTNGKVGKMTEAQWQGKKFFPKTNTYVVLYNNKSHYKIEKDTSLTQACVQWIYLKKRMAHTFRFQKINRCWLLKEIDITPFNKIANGNFFNFYARFTSDSVYQSRSIKEPLTFLTTETSSNTPIEGVLAIEQWFAFKPYLPHPEFANILYGQKTDDNSWKIMVIKGASNGSRCVLSFHKAGKRWQLVKYEN